MKKLAYANETKSGGSWRRISVYSALTIGILFFALFWAQNGICVINISARRFGLCAANERYVVKQISSGAVETWNGKDRQELGAYTIRRYGPFESIQWSGWNVGNSYLVLPTWFDAAVVDIAVVVTLTNAVLRHLSRRQNNKSVASE